MSDAALLTVDRMSIAFGEAQPVVKKVSCEVFPGQTTCIVGESGSGKTLTSLAVMGLLPGSGALTHGEVRGPDGAVWAKPGWHGAPVGRDVAMVFQDPMSSLSMRLHFLVYGLEELFPVFGLQGLIDVHCIWIRTGLEQQRAFTLALYLVFLLCISFISLEGVCV